MSDPARPLAPLAALANEWLGADAAARPTPLAEQLARHPQARALLTEALLECESGTGAISVGAGDDTAPGAAAAGETVRRVGRYELVREVGRGGQAVVYQARDPMLGRRVALKVLQRGIFSVDAAADRLRAEAATTSRLDHPAICPVYEIGEDGDLLYLAMRFVDGQTLAQRIAEARERAANGAPFELRLTPAATRSSESTTRTPRQVAVVLEWFEQVAAALDTAHRAGVCHRDIKPGNLMVQPDGAPVVLDFGLAGDHQRAGVTLTRSGDVFGTPAYMAPEQCRDARLADVRTDVFALGASLFEAVTGQRAFQADTPAATIKLVLAGRVPNPCRVVRSLPRDLGIVVGKALDPEPARRYATALEFAQDLQRIRELRPILAVPPGLPLRLRRWVQRNPVLTAFALVVVIAAAAVLLSLRDARSAKDDFGRLADAVRREDLQRAFDTDLFPVRRDPQRAAAWLQAAEELVARLPEHRRRLTELREQAGSVAPDELERARRGHPLYAELDRLVVSERSLEQRSGTAAALAAAAAAAPAMHRRIAELEAAIAADRPRRFAANSTQVVHDALVRLIADLEEFAATDGPLERVRDEVGNVSREQPEREVWASAIADLRSQTVYRDLDLQPQVGLRPLRRDPRTGYWEFFVDGTGAVPAVGADGSYRVTADTGMVLVLLPGGRCHLGCSDVRGTPRYDEQAVGRSSDLFDAEVELAPFFLGKYEVTQGQWQRLARGGNPSAFPPGKNKWNAAITLAHPVENVDWSEAVQALQVRGLVLPTEARWEYAARCGTDSPFYTGDRASLEGAANLYDLTAREARFNSNDPPTPWHDGFVLHAPVGSFGPNGFGLHDMIGNVSEWCLDEFAHPDLYLRRAGDGLLLAPAAGLHVKRDGCFGIGDLLARSGARSFANARDGYWGFRAAREVDR